jgi:hypothetical protein
MNERAEGRVVIPDADSQVLGQMLEWMYGGKTPDLADLDVALGLLGVAHRYQLEELVVKIGTRILFIYFSVYRPIANKRFPSPEWSRCARCSSLPSYMGWSC